MAVIPEPPKACPVCKEPYRTGNFEVCTNPYCMKNLSVYGSLRRICQAYWNCALDVEDEKLLESSYAPELLALYKPLPDGPADDYRIWSREQERCNKVVVDGRASIRRQQEKATETHRLKCPNPTCWCRV